MKIEIKHKSKIHPVSCAPVYADGSNIGRIERLNGADELWKSYSWNNLFIGRFKEYALAVKAIVHYYSKSLDEDRSHRQFNPDIAQKIEQFSAERKRDKNRRHVQERLAQERLAQESISSTVTQ